MPKFTVSTVSAKITSELTSRQEQTKTKKRKRRYSPQRFLQNFFAALLALAKGAVAGFLLIALATGLIAGAFLLIQNLVAPNALAYKAQPLAESTKIYASDGTLLYQLFKDEKRTVVPLAEISPHFINAILAAEDRDFFTHPGVSITSVLRAMLQDLTSSSQLYGGSTITQQLVKNTILSRERSFARKISEAVWALEIEKHLSKDEILYRYVNTISFGRNSGGVQEASLAYFGKPAKELTAAESAYLAALPQAPSLLRPGGPGRESLDGRQQYILQTMRDSGQLTDEEYRAAKAENVTFTPNRDQLLAPHFTLWMREQLLQTFGEDKVYNSGLKVYTTLDLGLQKLAETVVNNFAEKNKRNFRAYNASLVAINPKTGALLAMVGGKDYYGQPEPRGCTSGKNCLFDPNANVATSLRQVGSSFKPYVYVTAFGPDFKFSPSSIIADTSRNFSTPGAPAYIPRNYTGRQFGRIPMRKALAGSLNIAAVNTLSQIGTQNVISNLRSLGVNAPLKNCGLALALGSCEMTLLEHTAGFATIANLGRRNPVTGIDRVVEGGGKTIMQNKPENQPVLNPQAAYEVIDIMTDNDARSYIFGKNNPLTLPGRRVAAKTGTTQNWRDGFTVGFTPSLAVGVWTGNNDGTLQIAGSDGVVTAAPLWHEFMNQALTGQPAEDFPEPDGITRLQVNPATGQVLKGGKKGKLEVFASYAVPYENFQLPVKTAKKEEPKPPSRPAFADLTADQREETIILEPWEGDAITASPFFIKVYTGTSTVETVVEVYIDGKLIASKKDAPFLFQIPDQIPNGPHTLLVKAIHFGVLESSDTVKFNSLFNPPPLSPRGE